MKITTLFFLILLLINNSTYGQVGDCSGSLVLQNKDQLEFTFSASENLENDDLGSLCEGLSFTAYNEEDYLTYWFEWEIQEPGTLYFTLSRQVEFYDLDFVLYKIINSTTPCESKEAVRCMFSGASFTNGQLDNQCSMETGLSPLETDEFEDAGCNNMSNNFVQQLEAQAGEIYKLLVIDFDNSPDETTFINFCGTATLGEEDTPCFTLNNQKVEEDQITIFPNPVSNQLNIIKNGGDGIINYPYIIYDQLGKAVLEKQDKSQTEYIETSNLESGIYFIKIFHNNRSQVLKFVKY